MFSKTLDVSIVSFEFNVLQPAPVFRRLGCFAYLSVTRRRFCSDNKVLVRSFACLSEFWTLKTHRLTARQHPHLLRIFFIFFSQTLLKNVIKNDC